MYGELVKAIQNFDTSHIENLPRRRAQKVIEHLDISFNRDHNKVQKLPKFAKEIKNSSPKKPIPKETPVEQEKPQERKFPGQLKSLENLSWSSIGFSQEDNTVLEENYDPVPEIKESFSKAKDSFPRIDETWRSKFLDFSLIKERKTRKQMIDEMSFETEVHNIYNPEYETESSDDSWEKSPNQTEFLWK